MRRALMLQVMLKGLTVKHYGGSPTMTLSTGVGSVCINIKEDGPLARARHLRPAIPTKPSGVRCSRPRCPAFAPPRPGMPTLLHRWPRVLERVASLLC